MNGDGWNERFMVPAVSLVECGEFILSFSVSASIETELDSQFRANFWKIDFRFTNFLLISFTEIKNYWIEFFDSCRVLLGGETIVGLCEGEPAYTSGWIDSSKITVNYRWKHSGIEWKFFIMKSKWDLNSFRLISDWLSDHLSPVWHKILFELNPEKTFVISTINSTSWKRRPSHRSKAAKINLEKKIYNKFEKNKDVFLALFKLVCFLCP